MILALLFQLHEGESYYTIGWKELAVLGGALVVWLILKLANKEPEVGSMKQFIDLINARGGNILVCLILTIYFFSASMRVFYHLFALVVNKSLDEKSAIALMAIQFATSSAFGGAFGALLKTMSPESSYTSSSITTVPPSGSLVPVGLSTPVPPPTPVAVSAKADIVSEVKP